MAKEQLYELFVIFDSQSDEAEIRREFDVVQSLIEKRSAQFFGRAEWGLRNFTYPIKKRTSGHYVYYLFKAGADAPALISTALKMDEKVLRYMVVRAKPNSQDFLTNMQSKKAAWEAAAQTLEQKPFASKESFRREREMDNNWDENGDVVPKKVPVKETPPAEEDTDD